MKNRVTNHINIKNFLSTSLAVFMYFQFCSTTYAITKDQCNLEYQANVSKILNDKESSARDLSESVLGQSFQKLAYAHQLFADGSEKELKEYESKLDKYIKENYKYSMSASDVMKNLKDFSTPFQNAINKNHSSSSGAKNTTQEKLQALILFSRGLDDKKYHIEDYEKDALSKFNFRSHGKDVDGWGLFVGDVARNFYQRRFYDDKGVKDEIDKRFSKKKISVYDAKVKESIEALKEEILKMAQNMSDECQAFLKETRTNSGMCSLTNPYDVPTHDLILNAESILNKINNPDATFIEKPISVHYAGAQFAVKECMISESSANPGAYKVKMKMDFKYIPGADSEDWSMSLSDKDQTHKIPILNNDNSFENFKSNQTLQTISREITFDQVEFPNNNIDGPLEFHFNNKTGSQVKMFTIGDGTYERDFSGDGSKYLISCPNNIPKRSTASSKKKSYELKANNDNNNITLSLTKDGAPADFSSTELSGSSIQWTLPDGLNCEEKKEDKYKLNCKIITEVMTPSKAIFELVGHSINPEVANAPEKGEIDLKIPKLEEISIKVTSENFVESQTTKLTAKVSGVDGNPNIKWTLNFSSKSDKAEPKVLTGTSIDVGLFDTISYEVESAGKKISGTHSNKLTIKINNDGKNSTKDEKVNLIASINEKEFKGLKGDYSWECNDKPCGTGEKLSTKRTDKKTKIVAKFKAGEKLFTSGEVNLSKLKKEEKDKKKKKKDDECEEDDDKDSDPFSSKVKKDCSPKKEIKQFKKKYMPEMQQPLILPTSQPYITPGFN